MKYYNRPSWFCSLPKLMKCYDNDNIPFGRNVFNTLVDLIAQRFDYGDWWRAGKVQVPYGMDIMKRNFYFELGIKDSEAEQVMKILTRLSENDVIHFEDRGESIWIEYPDLMSMVDKTNEDKARELFGKGKITQKQMEEIVRTKELPEELRSNLEANDKKLINRKDNKKSSKPKVSINTQEESCLDNSKESKSDDKDGIKPKKNLSKITYDEICECKLVDIVRLKENINFYNSLSEDSRQEVDRRYLEHKDEDIPF